MGFFTNIRASIDDKSSMSVGSITLLISAFIGFLLGLVMCFVLVYDVVTNGYIKTDLTDAGIFLLCSGAYIAGSGLPKTIVDSRFKKRMEIAEQDMEYNAETKRLLARKEAGLDTSDDSVVEERPNNSKNKSGYSEDLGY